MRYIGKRKFIGLQNYIDIFTRDDIFGALKVSLFYLVGAIIQIALALFLATILTTKLKGAAFFKGAFFFPFMVCGIAIGFIFKFFFTHGSVLDSVLALFGVTNTPLWLQADGVNNVMLAATSVWRYVGQEMVLFIGAMMSVDGDVYEAADIDGANSWQKFWAITMPGIKNIIVLNMILAISGSLTAFEQPYVITGGAFNTATYFVIMDRIAHVNEKVGLASAMAVFLLFLIILVTIAQKLVSHFLLDEDETGRTYRERKAAAKREAAAN